MCTARTPAAPVLPPELAAMKYPDNGSVYDAAQRRVTDKVRSASNTILTSGSGVTSFSPTEKKTLLGA